LYNMEQLILDCLELGFNTQLNQLEDFEIELDFEQNEDKYKELIKARFINGRIIDDKQECLIEEYSEIILEQIVQLLIDKNKLQKMLNKIK
jgi:hypothetical protein